MAVEAPGGELHLTTTFFFTGLLPIPACFEAETRHTLDRLAVYQRTLITGGNLESPYNQLYREEKTKCIWAGHAH